MTILYASRAYRGMGRATRGCGDCRENVGTDFQSVKIELFQTPDDVNRLMRDADMVAQRLYQRCLDVGFSDRPFVRCA